jgi:hypothetical protein
MRQMLFATVAAAALATSPAAANETVFECDDTQITATGDFNVSDVCEAVDRVTNYFEGLGYETLPAASINFEEQVFATFTSKLDETKQEKIQVFAQANAETMAVSMTSFNSPSELHRESFGIPFNPEFASSILSHEIVHLQVSHILGEDYRKLTRSWHEFLAYSVQIHLMSDELRENVFSNVDEWVPASDMQVHALSYGRQPDAFAAGTYVYAMENGGLDENVRRVLSFEHDQIDVNTF